MKYDVIVIGSGPGGYVAAIRCAQLGKRTAIVEKYNTLGGTCLNVGCIPSKALLDSSEHFYIAKKRFLEHGIETTELKLNMNQMILRKADVVDQNVKGIAYLMKKNQIDVIHGHASFLTKNSISVLTADDESLNFEAANFIIATGSKPILPESFNYDKNRVISSTEALNLKEVPGKMVIVGGGVIGLELGSVYARLGTKVEVVEFLDTILAGMDKDCSKELMRSLKKLGIKFYLKHKVTEVEPSDSGVQLKVQKRDTDDVFQIEADYCLVAIGRKPYTINLGLENIQLELDEKGRIKVDEHLQTNVPGIYAIGDVIRGPMLAHKAEDEGIFVAELLAGQSPHIDYNLIPGVVYTWPEMAGVGKTEEELKEINKSYKVGKFPFKALGRSRASMDTEGLVKMIADKETDEILGIHIVGARAADLIMEGVVLMEFRASAEDVARICHPHPTYSEAIREAALMATENRPIHL